MTPGDRIWRARVRLVSEAGHPTAVRLSDDDHAAIKSDTHWWMYAKTDAFGRITKLYDLEAEPAPAPQTAIRTAAGAWETV
jgi:hypothetical protein